MHISMWVPYAARRYRTPGYTRQRGGSHVQPEMVYFIIQSNLNIIFWWRSLWDFMHLLLYIVICICLVASLWFLLLRNGAVHRLPRRESAVIHMIVRDRIYKLIEINSFKSTGNWSILRLYSYIEYTMWMVLFPCPYRTNIRFDIAWRFPWVESEQCGDLLVAIS